MKKESKYAREKRLSNEAEEDALRCVFCNESRSATGFKNKWICEECFPELREIFKTYYYVERVTQLTNMIEEHLKKHLK